MMHETLPHSGHYFGDQRDFWWNFDFLALITKRWDLPHYRALLDVGGSIWSLL